MTEYSEGDSASVLQRFYRERVRQHGLSYTAVWGDEAEWKAAERFRIIERDDLDPDDVLADLGCGIGLLKKHLDRAAIPVRYIGIDVVSEFLNSVRVAYGVPTHEIDFFGNLEELPDADWYCVFGSLNKKWTFDPAASGVTEQVYQWIAACFSKARKGLYLTCFTAMAPQPKAENVHLDPFRIVSMLGGTCRRFRVRHDMSFYEFSIMVAK